MKHKNKSHFLSVILILAIIAIVAVVLTPRLVSQSKIVQTLQTNAKDKELARLEAVMMEIKNKDSQEYKEARQKYCLLKSRPAAEREQASSQCQRVSGYARCPCRLYLRKGQYRVLQSCQICP